MQGNVSIGVEGGWSPWLRPWVPVTSVSALFVNPKIYSFIFLFRFFALHVFIIQRGPKVVKDAHACLRNFCQWQHEHNNPDDSHPTHYDTAVLITA